MTIKIYTLEQRQEWDQVVRSFFEYDAYWLSGYVKAFQLHGDGIPLLFYFKNNSTRGINVVMKRDIADDKYFSNILPKGKYFDFSTPYGYGGWIIEGNNTKELFTEYENWCRKHNIVSEFVRFHPIIENNVYAEEAYETVPLGKTVTMDLSTHEVIWQNLTSKNRNMIRKASKNGIKIYNGRYPQIFDIFKSIYNSTMDRDDADSYYYFDADFYNSILEDIPNNAQIFYAELDERVIAASIILTANGRMNYHLSGSLKEYSSLAPTNLLLYKAALWGCMNNCRTLYLGGGVGSGEDNLFKFKKSFYRNDDLKRFYIGKKIFLSKEYNELINIRNTEKTNFFPQYRA